MHKLLCVMLLSISSIYASHKATESTPLLVSATTTTTVAQTLQSEKKQLRNLYKQLIAQAQKLSEQEAKTSIKSTDSAASKLAKFLAKAVTVEYSTNQGVKLEELALEIAQLEQNGLEIETSCKVAAQVVYKMDKKNTLHTGTLNHVTNAFESDSARRQELILRYLAQSYIKSENR